MKEFSILFGVKIDKWFNAASVCCLWEERERNNLITCLLEIYVLDFKIKISICFYPNMVLRAFGSMWYTSFVFENTPVKKAIKHLLPLCLSSGQVGYTKRILCLLQEFWFYYLFQFIICFSTDAIHCVIHSRDKKGHCKFPQIPCCRMNKEFICLSIYLISHCHRFLLQPVSVWHKTNFQFDASTHLFSCNQELISIAQHEKWTKNS